LRIASKDRPANRRLDNDLVTLGVCPWSARIHFGTEILSSAS
jgi:hypothetical protein